jgi:hypothetical protein
MPNPLANIKNRLSGGRLHLGIASQGLAIARYSSAWNKNKQVLGDITCAPDQLKPGCDSLLTNPACSGLPIAVTLGNSWGQLFMVTPPAHVDKKTVLVAAAGMRFQALFGKNKTEWQIEADWQIDRPFLACAFPKPLLTTLLETAKQRQITLLSISPYFVSAWNTWRGRLKSGSWFGVVSDGMLVLGMTSTIHPEELAEIRSIPIPAHGQSADWLEEQLHRTALQHGVGVPEQIHIVGNLHRYWRQQGVAVTEQRVVNLDDNNLDSNTASAALQLIVRGAGL